MNPKRHFSEDDISRLQPTEKIGLLATVNSSGKPHITLITSLQPADHTRMVFGEFVKGLSKKHVQQNPKTAFLLMTLDRAVWRGRADYTHLRTEGPEYRMLNEKPMFRYNAYLGINTVYYFELQALLEKQHLPMPAIIRSALATRLAKPAAKSSGRQAVLNPMAEKIFNMPGALKFIAWMTEDGYPALVPVPQCQAADSTRLAFSPGPYGEELKNIPLKAEVAVFALTLRMEDVLVRGTFNGFTRSRGVSLATMDINWVYNSMPPVPGQIYPEVPLEPVS